MTLHRQTMRFFTYPSNVSNNVTSKNIIITRYNQLGLDLGFHPEIYPIRNIIPYMSR